MKKLLGIVVLVLFLLVGCSKNKEDAALENCADNGVSVWKNEDLWKYENEFKRLDRQLNYVLREIKTLEKEEKRIKNEKEEEINKYYITNPEPPKGEMYFFEWESEEKKKEYQKQWAKHSYWEAGFNPYRDNIIKKYDSETKFNILNMKIKVKERNSLRTKIDDFKKKIGRKKIEKMNLSEKKKLNGYVGHYMACEQFYKRSKKTFMLQYGN